MGAYKVQFSEKILKDIHNSVYFPGETFLGFNVQKLPRDSHLLEVKSSVTLRKLNDLVSDIKRFLGSLLEMIPMLDHFHLNESVIFKAFVKSELPNDGSISTEQLAEILKRVKDKLHEILTGVVTLSDFEPIAGAAMNLRLIKREVKIMTDYPDFQEYRSTDAVIHFESVIILHQILDHINSLFTFCEEFGLQECLKSDEVGRLKDVVSGYKSGKSWNEKNFKNITAIVTEIQDLLGIKFKSRFGKSTENRSERFMFLTLFEPLNTNTKELRRFLNENNFRGKGQIRFEQLLSLVTQRFQHEEYNAEILTKLYAVYYLLVPLNNPDLSIHELLETVSHLEPSTCLSQLRTVDSNIDLITMWFSRAEVNLEYLISALIQIDRNNIFFCLGRYSY